MTLEQGKPYRRGARRGDGRGRHHRLVRRGRPPRLWPHRPGPRPGHSPVGRAGADRRRSRPLRRGISRSTDAGPQDRAARSRPAARIILKASGRNARRAASRLVRCFVDAGLPPGVLNLVFGVPAEFRASDRRSRRSARFPSPARSRSASSSPRWPAQHMKRATMELGGHAPVDRVRRCRSGDGGRHHRRRPSSATPARSASRRRASWCRKTIYDNSSSASPNTPKAVKLGDGLDKGTRWARWPTRAASRRWRRLSTTPRRSGGKIAGRRRAHRQPGLLLRADRLTDVPDDCEVDERGAVRPARADRHRSRRFDEAVERANSLPFGLAAYAFTRSARPPPPRRRASRVGMLGDQLPSRLARRRRRSAASRIPATAAKAAPKAWSAYLVTKFISQG